MQLAYVEYEGERPFHALACSLQSLGVGDMFQADMRLEVTKLEPSWAQVHYSLGLLIAEDSKRLEKDDDEKSCERIVCCDFTAVTRWVDRFCNVSEHERIR